MGSECGAIDTLLTDVVFKHFFCFSPIISLNLIYTMKFNEKNCVAMPHSKCSALEVERKRGGVRKKSSLFLTHEEGERVKKEAGGTASLGWRCQFVLCDFLFG